MRTHLKNHLGEFWVGAEFMEVSGEVVWKDHWNYEMQKCLIGLGGLDKGRTSGDRVGGKGGCLRL